MTSQEIDNHGAEFLHGNLDGYVLRPFWDHGWKKPFGGRVIVKMRNVKGVAKFLQ